MKQIINIGITGNDGLGEPLRDGLDKVNDNFTEVYDAAVKPAYFYFAGDTFRIGPRGGALCIDQAITPTGFAGAENTDWANVIEFILP